MKKIVCELCECTEFTKDGGMFVCQSCGTKYTAEEARGMMRDIDGGETTSTTSPVVNTNQQLDNVLFLATSAYEADNKVEAENYCNQAIVLDAKCYRAWMLKGKAVGWQSTIDNLRIEEAAHSFCKAIDFAPEEEKELLKTEAGDEIKRLGIALITLRKNRFSANPETAELNGFTSDKGIVLKSLIVLLSHGNAVGIPDGYLEEVASLMNQAGVAALNMVRTAWNSVEYPNENDFNTYLGWNANISQVFREAISTSDEDDESDIVRYNNLIISLEEPMTVGACSYTREWISWKSEYDWVKQYTLSDSAIASRKKEVKECKAKIAEIQNKIKEKKAAEKKAAAAAKKERIKAYWNEHKEEKNRLDAEKKQLTEIEKNLKSEIEELEKQIKFVENEKSKALPSECELALLKKQKEDLLVRKSKLGLFAFKDKKQLTEEILVVDTKLEDCYSKVEKEKVERNNAIKSQISPLKSKIEEFEKELSSVTAKKKEIVAELNRDRS